MDTRSLFPDLPDAARVWIYTADRPLTSDEQRHAVVALRSFVQQWTSHGRKVHGAVDVVEDRFVILAEVLEEGDISGCGIDASTRVLRELSEKLGVEWLSNLSVLYRAADGRVQAASRAEFKELARQGAVGPGTPVFDASVTTLGALRKGQFEQPAGHTWHRRFLAVPQPEERA